MAEAGTVIVNVQPVLDEEAFTLLVSAMCERINRAINRAIRDAVQVSIAERAAQ